MPLRITDAKCPSALQVSGMMEDGKRTPDSLLIPLSAYERTVPTTSPVVAFTKSPLRRGTSAFRVNDWNNDNERRAHPVASAWTRVPNGPSVCIWVEVTFNCPVKMAVSWNGGRELCADAVAAEEATTAARNEKNEEESMFVLDAAVDV